MPNERLSWARQTRFLMHRSSAVAAQPKSTISIRSDHHLDIKRVRRLDRFGHQRCEFEARPRRPRTRLAERKPRAHWRDDGHSALGGVA
jgi:hypothetical protein